MAGGRRAGDGRAGRGGARLDSAFARMPRLKEPEVYTCSRGAAVRAKYFSAAEDIRMPKARGSGCKRVVFGTDVPEPAVAADVDDFLAEVPAVEVCGDGCRGDSGETEGKKTKRSNKCKTTDCDKIASFGVEGGSAVACKTHSTDDMINLKAARCQTPGCKTVACFGLPNGKVVSCKAHSVEDMVNLVSKICETPGCETQCKFGFEGSGPIACKKHKLAGMICWSTTFCSHPGCTITASFGPRGKRPIVCKEHTEEGFVRRHTECEHDDCQKTATHGLPESRKRTHCAEHAPEGLKRINDIPKPCKVEGCTNPAKYGDLGCKADTCEEHKSDDQLLSGKQLCTFPGCIVSRTFGPPDGMPLTCRIRFAYQTKGVRNRRVRKDCKSCVPRRSRHRVF